MLGGGRLVSHVGALLMVWGVLSAPGVPRVTSAHHSGHAGSTHAAVPVRQLLEIYDCTVCHRLTEPHRLIGPSLWKLGERADAAAIRAAILTPDAVVTPGYPAGLMRARLEQVGFYKDLVQEPGMLDRIVTYLLQPGAPPSIPQAAQEPQGAQALATPPVAGVDSLPVTKAQYAAFIADHGYGKKRLWDRIGWAVVVQRRNRTHPNGWQAERDAVSQEPVVGVSWYEAEAYCHWAGKELPIEPAWERRCKEDTVWQGPAPESNLQWEWTAEAVWRGTQGRAEDARCSARVPSHQALDGRYTGFRCMTATGTSATSGK